uniref:Protein arginine methyltransferase NDUFAF7 n=1 Tax=Glycine max TaxID=3847 RepID=A0A0R0G0E9_SOYBN
MLSRTRTFPLISLASKVCAPPLEALYSTHIVGDKPVLVRDFIHSALYHPLHGYFSQRSRSVGVLPNAIKFNQLQGRKAYMKYLDNIYKQSDISWFTPVELFKPWYAHAIAEAIMRTANFSVPLKIYEIGGGSGTCAKGIMDYIMLNAPAKVYNSMTYISVEISPSLAEVQRETVGEVRSHIPKFRVECRDAADRIGWGQVEQQPCWVIMLEVLDNLPHDLIYAENQISSWMEVWVERQHDQETFSELYKPLQDSLITRCVEIMDLDKTKTTQSTAASTMKSIWSKVYPKPRRCWLPTGCLKDGSSLDYDSYMEAKGDADIFFPTDFWLLEQIDHYCSGWLKLHGDHSSKKGKKRRTITLESSSFMEEFGLPTKTRTKDGYNPLLDDFKNTKFYLSVPTHNIK